MEKLSSKDLLLIACSLYPDIERGIIRKMIKFNKKVLALFVFYFVHFRNMLQYVHGCLRATEELLLQWKWNPVCSITL